MNHLSEEQLALHYYGEAGGASEAESDAEGTFAGAAAVAQHLAECAVCRREFEQLQVVLRAVQMPVPEPAARYENDVWERIRPRLAAREKERQKPWSLWPAGLLDAGWGQRWAAAAALAVVLVGVFMFGRWFERRGITPNEVPRVQTAAERKATRDHILLVAVGDHLERSQMVLVELINTRPGREVDISAQQETARRLLDDNRLYRQTALQVEDRAVGDLLDELERLLVDLSHRPATVNEREFDDIRQRIEAQGILFRVRVVGSQMRQRERVAQQAAPSGPHSKT